MTAPIAKQFSDAFNHYAAEGRAAHVGAELSHVCFKFASQEAYADYVTAAKDLGTVTSEQFNGKEITWVHLAAPLEKDGLLLEYLELVEPRTEKHAFNGVANIGYAVAGLSAAVKLASSDNAMSFRYQSLHAKQMAPKP
jgi:predicted metalloenzyme YecM